MKILVAGGLRVDFENGSAEEVCARALGRAIMSNSHVFGLWDGTKPHRRKYAVTSPLPHLFGSFFPPDDKVVGFLCAAGGLMRLARETVAFNGRTLPLAADFTVPLAVISSLNREILNSFRQQLPANPLQYRITGAALSPCGKRVNRDGFLKWRLWVALVHN